MVDVKVHEGEVNLKVIAGYHVVIVSDTYEAARLK